MAQQVTALVEFTNTWRYNNLRTDLGTAWRASAFSDAAWVSGPALLGFEDTVPNPYAIHGLTVNPIDIGPNPGRTPTIYFRSHFTSPVAGTSPGVSLIMSNLVDDGCVIYLNGTEAARIRVAASQIYASFASSGPNSEGTNEAVVINPALLRAGDNVLAVEVHNGSDTSSDLVWGTRVMLIRDTALVITNQPQNQTAAVGDAVTNRVGVSGGPAFYQWQKGAGTIYTNIAGASSATYVISPAAFANAGNYRVVVSNSITVVTSLVATLSVFADTDGPIMTDAIVNNFLAGSTFGINTINVHFDEVLLEATARNTNNYQLLSATNSNIRVPIVSISYNGSVATGVRLTVEGTNANWRPTNSSYYLIVNNVADLRGNNIAPNSVIGVSSIFTTNLTQMSDVWNYYDFNLFDPNGVDIYINTADPWYGTNYVVANHYGWGTGAGILDTQNVGRPDVTCGGDTVGQAITFNVGTDPNTGFEIEVPTLFRRTFNLPGGLPANGSFRLRYAVDDGMVVYLNGVEIHRYNMPTGPLSYLSRASTEISGQNANSPIPCITNVVIPVSGLKPGANVLAAGVYQAATIGQNDTTFGLEMDLISVQNRPAPTNRPPGTPTLVRNVISTPQGPKFVLSWPATNYGYNLQYSTNIVGTASNWWRTTANWTQVPDQSNPYTNMIPPTTGPRRFYRLFRETLN